VETDNPCGYSHKKEEILQRLRKVEGQVRGLQRMVSEGRYCVDILNQVSAVRAALVSLGLMVLEEHTRGSIPRAVQENKASEIIDELMQVINRLIK